MLRLIRKKHIFNDKFMIKFWSKVKVSLIFDCWEWQVSRDKDGYGIIMYKKKTFKAHRISWMIKKNRKIPEGMYICHHCDNPSCVNPNHLFLGTRQDNIDDMVKKGRSLYGERNPAAKLTEKVIKRIVSFLEKGITQKDISLMFNISESQIQAIASGKSWTNITNGVVEHRDNLCGENGSNVKLTWKKVRRLRRLYAQGTYSQSQLAKLFGVGRPNIGLIVNNKRWIGRA